MVEKMANAAQICRNRAQMERDTSALYGRGLRRSRVFSNWREGIFDTMLITLRISELYLNFASIIFENDSFSPGGQSGLR